MLWRLDTRSERTYADQLAAQVRRAVSDGELSPGDRLPSARALAAMLEINLHTVLRAYQELRDEGVLDLRRGRGATIAPGASTSRAGLEALARDLATEALRTGAELQEAIDAVVRAWPERTAGAAGAERPAPRPTRPTDLTDHAHPSDHPAGVTR
ncbi:GntR family transcriptional regulator [Miniimonas arenae]|uniref:GntR family transcriptional regulator n=1 Tax=Miniimonas arenae TaxID=676201 RepID=UPI0028B2225C|nr:GntR family transcriptional regulator [Miniimonas arenae]